MSAPLVLLEDAGAAGDALRFIRERPEARLVALSPAAIEALEDAGAPFTVPEDHLAADALSCRGRRNYALLEDLGRALEPLAAELPARLNPVFLHFYRLKVAVDSLGLRALELDACADAADASALEVFSSSAPLWEAGKALHLLTSDGPVYGETAGAIAAGRGLEAKVRRRSCARKPAPSRLRRALAAARPVARLLPGLRAGAVWQLGEAAHDVPELLALLERRFPVARFENVLRDWPARAAAGPSGEKGAYARLWERAEPVFATHPLFRHGSADLWPLLRPALKRLVLEDQPRAEAAYFLARRLARWRRPRAVLALGAAYPENAAAAAALRAEGIPVVFVQEGGFCGYVETAMHHHCELSWADWFLAYGRGVADHFVSHRPTPRQRAVCQPAGCWRLRRAMDRARAAGAARKSGAGLTVMYVATHFQHALRYAPLCRGDRDYYLLRRRALEALMKAPGLDIVYKGLPAAAGADPLEPFLRRNARRIRVARAPLTALLGEADWFVVDWPSTVLLELAASRGRLDVLLDAKTTPPLAAGVAALERRARVSRDPAAFAAALAGGPPPAQSDDSFLRDYGLGEWDDAALLGFFDGL